EALALSECLQPVSSEFAHCSTLHVRTFYCSHNSTRPPHRRPRNIVRTILTAVKPRGKITLVKFLVTRERSHGHDAPTASTSRGGQDDTDGARGSHGEHHLLHFVA